MKDYKDLWRYQIHKIHIQRWNGVNWGQTHLKEPEMIFILRLEPWMTFELCKSFDLVSDDVITHTRTGTFDKGILQLFVLSTAKFWNVKPRVIRITWKGL